MEDYIPFDAFNDHDFLEHHGIKGMKWGVRRSPEQLGHRSGSRKSGKSKKKANKRKPSKDYIESRRISKKKVYEMSNEELKIVNNRLNLERNYKNLKHNRDSEQRVKNVLKTTGKVATVAISLAALYGVTDKIVKKYNLSDSQADSISRSVEAAKIISKLIK